MIEEERGSKPKGIGAKPAKEVSSVLKIDRVLKANEPVLTQLFLEDSVLSLHAELDRTFFFIYDKKCDIISRLGAYDF